MTTSQFVAMEMNYVPEDSTLSLFLVISCRSHLHYLPMSDVLLTFPVKVYGLYANAVCDHSLLCPDGVDTLTLAQDSSPFLIISVSEQEATSP